MVSQQGLITRPQAVITSHSGGDTASKQFFVGRTASLDQLLHILQAPGYTGAAIIGGAGIGKTAVLQRVMELAAQNALLVRVRASKQSARIPYKAINFLLAELSPEQTTHPVAVLRGLTDALRSKAQGRTVIISVDNAEHLDPMSALVISQLVSSRIARVLLATRRFSRTDPEFMGLWREGSLHRCELDVLTPEEARLFIEKELGGAASSEAVRAVFAQSAGNPRYMRGIIREMRRQRLLVQSSDTWVAMVGKHTPCREASETALELLEGTSPEQQRVVRLVSLAGRVPLSLLLSTIDGPELDGLEDAELITVEQDLPVTVTTSSKILAVSVCALVPGREALELYEWFVDQAGETTLAALDAETHVAWRLRAGLPVDAGLAVAAARKANDAGRYGDALALYGFDQNSPALAIEALRGLLGTGELDEAYVVLARICPLPVEDLAPAEFVRLGIAETELNRRQGCGATTLLLDEAARRLIDSNLPAATAKELHYDLLVARAELASYEGKFTENIARLQGLDGHAQGQRADTRVRLQSLLCEAWVMTARQDEALELAWALADSLTDPALTGRTRELTRIHVLEAYRIAGTMNDCETRLAQIAQPVEGASPAGSYENVLKSLADAHAGRLDKALTGFVREFDQLAVNDPHGLLPIVAAGTAYCHSRARNLDSVIEFLRRSEARTGSSWKARWTARYFQLLGSAYLGSRSTAARELHALAGSNGAQEAIAFQLSALCSAVRLGYQPALGALSAVSGRMQGPFARLCETYAKGIDSQDSELLVQAIEMASALGEEGFAGEIAQSAMQYASTCRDKQASRRLKRSVRDALPVTATAKGAGSKLEGLTRREREVARIAAGGASNKEIAQQMCVSIRTVEGHLYQVYSKLDVCTRQELAGLVLAEHI